jgi:hypothetical protein
MPAVCQPAQAHARTITIRKMIDIALPLFMGRAYSQRLKSDPSEMVFGALRGVVNELAASTVIAKFLAFSRSRDVHKAALSPLPSELPPQEELIIKEPIYWFIQIIERFDNFRTACTFASEWLHSTVLAVAN